MTTDDKSFKPRDSRFKVIDKERMVVVFESPTNGETEVAGELIDITAGGAKLRVAGAVNVSNEHGLRILVSGLPMPMYVDAEVCWSQLEPDDSWTLGCKFEPKLPEEFLVQLTKAGILNRRDAPRTKASSDATATFDNEGTPMRIRVHNVSDHGLCFQTDKQCTTGAVALIQNDEQQLFASCRVRWQMPFHGGYLVGCQAEDDASRNALTDFRSHIERPWKAETDEGSWPRIYCEESDDAMQDA